jgi:hypothetical protein
MNSAPAANGIEAVLSRLLLVASSSARAARRKDAASPKASPRSKRNAARFLKTFYAVQPSPDPEVSISDKGLFTLKWVKIGNLPDNGSRHSAVTLIIDEDNAWHLEVDGRKPVSGEKADKNLAQLLHALIGPTG